jgi:predicted RNase H-like HicB family nuclease
LFRNDCCDYELLKNAALHPPRELFVLRYAMLVDSEDHRRQIITIRRLEGMNIELEREEDGRWIAEVIDPPGAMAYGATREEAMARVKARALRILADRLEHGIAVPEIDGPELCH